ncbi:glycosyltransferase family 39 protein [Yoonia sp. R2331]|uniref:glycosyltransferase family 39 protein n=1 Tax=Yoonia sp. R2331 TaxID=3237238 RepID=UPI0034E5C202
MNKSVPPFKLSWPFLLLIILTVGTALRIWAIGYKTPWGDELHSLSYARTSVAHLIDIGRTTDIHPPLYFLSLKGWVALFGESRDAARLFSATLGVAAIGLLFVIVKRLYGIPAALIAAAFLATFPTAIQFDRDIRMYPLLRLLFLLSFLCFLGLRSAPRADRAGLMSRVLPLIGFAVSLALAFYTHYTAALFYMLFTLVGLYYLLRGDRMTLFWVYLGLFIATILVLPQLNHLFSSSLGDPDKSWMQATTLRIFYGTTLGAFPYPMWVKPVAFLAMVAGFVLLWMRDRDDAVVFFLFTAGGMILAAVIGIYEPIYLVRTIQVFTVFTAIFVAMLLLRLPRPIAVLIGAVLLVANALTTVQNSFVPAREFNFADRTGTFVALMDPAQDQVFAKEYLMPQMVVARSALVGLATPISHDSQDADIAAITKASDQCLTADSPCRSLILIVERLSRFDPDAIARWNALADTLIAKHPGHVEQDVAGYRVVVVSQDTEFLNTVTDVLAGDGR